MKKYLIEQVSTGTSKEGEKNGRKWKVTNMGVKIAGVWHNSGIFNDLDIKRLNESEGKEIFLELFEEEYQEKMYKKFKMPSGFQILEMRIDALEKKVFGSTIKPEPEKEIPENEAPLPDEPPDEPF